MKSFVGDFSRYLEEEDKGWRGDEMEIQVTHGDVRLTFDQENGNPSSTEDEGMDLGRSRSTFMNRLLFGL